MPGWPLPARVRVTPPLSGISCSLPEIVCMPSPATRAMSGSRQSATTGPGPGVSRSFLAGAELRRGVDGHVDAITAAAEPVAVTEEAIPGEQQNKHDDDHGEDGDHTGRRAIPGLP